VVAKTHVPQLGFVPGGGVTSPCAPGLAEPACGEVLADTPRPRGGRPLGLCYLVFNPAMHSYKFVYSLAVGPGRLQGSGAGVVFSSSTVFMLSSGR